MRHLPYYFLVLVVFVADQLSKWGVTEYLIRPRLGEEFGISRPFFLWLTSAPERLPPVELPVLPFFNIVMVWNKGVSFGLMNNATDYGPWILTALALVIVAVFSLWLVRSVSAFQSFGIALVIGGALGNVVDRVRFGAVVDFLDFHIAGWHWPAFNVSDSCICVGVFLLILQSFFFEKPAGSAK